MLNITECVKFFKDNLGFDRFFRALKRNYEKHGYFYGNIQLDKVTDEEKDAFSGFMKRDYKKVKNITINISKFVNRLQETKFGDIELLQILNGYFDTNIISEVERKNSEQKDKEKIISEILKETKDKASNFILRKIIDNRDNIYFMINNHYKRVDNATFKRNLLDVCNAIDNLPKEKVRLAVFAARITKNPHGLDQKYFTGRLFIAFLSIYSKCKIPKTTEKISELLYINNILLDDVSNMVLAYGISAYMKDELHSGFEYFKKYNEPLQVTLNNLSKIEAIKACDNKVLVVENPNVFTAILDDERLKNLGFSLVCTYGQVRLAGLVLLDLLVKGGAKIYYSGDIDPEGIQIADNLYKRYLNNIDFIGFTEDVYNKNLSDVCIGKSRLKMLEQITCEKLKEISNVLKKNTEAAYEELNINNLVKFILEGNEKRIQIKS